VNKGSVKMRARGSQLGASETLGRETWVSAFLVFDGFEMSPVGGLEQAYR
jgi:hypothetical protein